jgi:hypothetical protein
MISHPARNSSSLPDYYGDERRAMHRVRVRRSFRWLGLAVVAATLLVWQTGR